MIEELVRVRDLNQFTEIHNTDSVREVFDNGQVMRNKHDRESHALTEIIQQVDDLRLNGHIER